jgi:hypothetical protein
LKIVNCSCQRFWTVAWDEISLCGALMSSLGKGDLTIPWWFFKWELLKYERFVPDPSCSKIEKSQNWHAHQSFGVFCESCGTNGSPPKGFGFDVKSVLRRRTWFCKAWHSAHSFM